MTGNKVDLSTLLAQKDNTTEKAEQQKAPRETNGVVGSGLTNSLDVSGSAPAATSASTIATNSPKKDETLMDKVSKALSLGTQFKAARVKCIILPDGSKVWPDADGIFPTDNAYVLEQLEYFAKQGGGLIEVV